MEIKNYFAQDAQGNIMPSANCYLYLPGTTTLATGLVDVSGTPISNPFPASAIGQVQFGAPNGAYDLRMTKGVRDTTIRIQCADIVQAMSALGAILGPKSTPPTTRDDTSPLQVGDTYFSIPDNMDMSWNGQSWISPNSYEIIYRIYTDGSPLSIIRSTQLVDRDGVIYKIKMPSSFPVVLTGNWVSDQLKLEIVSDPLLRNRLAEPTGLGMSGYSRSELAIQIENAAQYLDSLGVNVRMKRFVDLITDRPDPNDYKTWNWDPAIQGAVDYVYGIALATGRINALPPVIVPGALYKMSKGITTFPWIKIQSIGEVTWDYSAAPVTESAFWVQNKVTWTQGEPNVSVSGALSPCIDGSRGVMYIRGQGFDASQAPCFRIGNDVDGYDPARDIQICNVFPNRWLVAVDFLPYDTFLCTIKDSRLEFNKYNVRLPLAPYQNSGERVQFENCTLAGALASILCRGPAFDLHFIGCSFDFNTDILLIDGGTYCSFNFTNCHYEGWDGALINCKTAASWVFVNIVNTTILPSGYLNKTNFGLNGAGRPLFITTGTGTPGQGIQINLTNPRIGIVARCYSEEPFISSGNATVNVTGTTIYERNFAGNAQNQGLRDWQFQMDADGTLASALSMWTVDNLNLIDSAASKLVTVEGKKVLQMKASGSESTSYLRLTSKDRTPVSPGQYVFAWAAASMAGTTGTANLQPNVIFYDSLGNALPIPTLFASYNMRTAFNDATMPNFAQGDARYMATEPGVYKAPPGAASVAFRSMFTVFGGTFNISRASIHVAK